MTDEVQEKCRKVFQKDMETSDLMTELVDEHEPEDIEQAVVDVVQDAVEDIQHDRRKLVVFSTTAQIGKVIESKDLVEFADRNIQRFREKHG